MARIAICLILATGVAAGILFVIDPSLDIYISKLIFVRGGQPLAGLDAAILSAAREFHIKVFATIIGISASALVLRVLFPRMPMLVPARGAWLILLTYLIGPGLIANAVFKENWGRPRPAHVEEFGGAHSFKPWWDPTGSCPKNCSFVSGEASAGFAVLAIAALAPMAWRLQAVALALGFGLVVSLMRVAAGGHFASDVIFAGVLTAFVVWLLHGLIYRWPATRLSERQAEQRLDALGRWLRGSFAVGASGIANRARGAWLRPDDMKIRSLDSGSGS